MTFAAPPSSLNPKQDGEVAVRIQGSSIQIGGYAVSCVDGALRVV